MIAPQYSIVIPAFNREQLIGRCLASCLSQEGPPFEIIVVDDGSSDGTADVVESIGDSRTRLIRHDMNRGVCPARNTGIDVARGEWIILLDSDDALAHGALRVIQEQVARVGSDIGRLVFCYAIDTGGISPEDGLPGAAWDYRGYLQWCATPRRAGDFLNVVRRTAFSLVRYPDSHALEGSFHLDFARTFRTLPVSLVVATLYTDANNRSASKSSAALRKSASDMLASRQRLLADHGTAMRDVAPQLYGVHLRTAATWAFLDGQRALGLRYLAEHITHAGFTAHVLGAAVAGIIGPCVFATAKRLGDLARTLVGPLTRRG